MKPNLFLMEPQGRSLCACEAVFSFFRFDRRSNFAQRFLFIATSLIGSPSAISSPEAGFGWPFAKKNERLPYTNSVQVASQQPGRFFPWVNLSTLLFFTLFSIFYFLFSYFLFSISYFPSSIFLFCFGSFVSLCLCSFLQKRNVHIPVDRKELCF